MMNAAAPATTPPPQLPPINFAPLPSDLATQLLMAGLVVASYFALNLIWGLVDDLRRAKRG